ncbi:MAG: glycosyltransferase family 4 protein [Chloroflexi bacterium]|nr:glycosyltransferase family 4 protein [Chloroflexota bacterium]
MAVARSPMYAVYIAPFGFAPKNTTGRRVMPMARAAAAMGHRIRVIVPPYDDPATYGREWEDGEVEVTCLSRPTFDGTVLIGSAWTQWRLARAAAELVMEWRPDLVHVFKPKAVSGLAQMLIARRRERPAVVLDLDDWEGRAGWSQNEDYPRTLVELFEIQERLGMRRCEAFTAASGLLAERAGAVAPDCPRLHIPNGFDPAAYENWAPDRVGSAFRRSLGIASDAKLILIYTRFFDYGLEAWARVIRDIAERSPTARFLVLGAGKFGQERDLAADMRVSGLADRMSFLGWLPFADIPSALAAVDVALMPLADTVANRAKCSPRYIDLMYAGVPVVTTPVGEALTFICDGETGFVAADATPGAVAETVLRALGATEIAGIRMRASERATEELSWERLTAPLTELYESAVARAASRRA